MTELRPKWYCCVRPGVCPGRRQRAGQILSVGTQGGDAKSANAEKLDARAQAELVRDEPCWMGVFAKVDVEPALVCFRAG